MSRAPFHVNWPSGISSDGSTLRYDPRATIVPRRLAEAPRQRAGTQAPRERAGTQSERQRAGTHDDSELRPGADRGQRLILGELLGQGGMAVVREATQVSLSRTVAVKSLPPDRTPSPNAVVELLEEAWITGVLEHPNVVPIYDVDTDEDGNPHVVLKRIEGVPWRQLMSDAVVVRERFGADLLEWNLGVLLQVLNALRYAHSRGIVHRDLKPDNVMVGEFGEVYVVDWGLAVSLHDDGGGRLPLAQGANDELAGTPCYMAPEMLPGMGLSISERTDIYLAGAILCEILTGEPPHRADTLDGLAYSVITSQPPLPPGTPTRLAAICRRAMDPDPTGRFESAEQVRLAIQGYLRHRDANRLLQEAESRLAELQVAVANARAESIEDRQRIYKLYGECRVGFREAELSRSERDAAQEGKSRAARLMIEYELGSGEPRAAATLMADLAVPDAAIEQQVARALDADQARRRQAARLERMGQALDMNAGLSTRRGLVLVLGCVWIATPLLNQWLAGRGVERTHLGLGLTTGILLALCVCLAWLARPLLNESLVNRRYFAALTLVYVTQGLLHVGMALSGLPLALFPMFSLLIGTVLLAMVVVTLDGRMWPAALGYAAAFLVVAAWHDARFFAHAGANLALVLTAVIVWAPSRADDG